MPLTPEQHTALDAVKTAGLFRSRRILSGACTPVCTIDGRRMVLLCSNNYLGLAGDPALMQAAADALNTFGVGAGAASLISGYTSLHQALEKAMADWKGTDAALLFPSGYQANIGVLSAVAGPETLILSDALNHASLIDGIRLSGGLKVIYRHADAGDLAQRLRAHRHEAAACLIVTEGLFSMDGDVAPLQEIFALAGEYNAQVLVDDAHGTGVLGPEGAGALALTGLRGRADLEIATFGKALGSAGAVVCGSHAMIEFLMQKARSYFFSTASPPPVVAAALCAVEIARREDGRRRTLYGHIRRLREGLAAQRWRITGADHQIQPVMIGDTHTAMKVFRQLFEAGIFILGIRPPTVPEGAARLRIAPMATHTDEQIDQALEAFQKIAETVPGGPTLLW